jgi:flagellar export protein FliJ
MEHREREAARQLQLSREHLQRQHLHLQELLSYHAEYEHTFQRSLSHGMNASNMLEYQLFLQRLNETIEQQRQWVEAADREHRLSRQSWLRHHRRRSATTKVAERSRDEENYLQNRREQKEIDDGYAQLNGPEWD